VTFLLADDDALAGSRRRRAIALLAAYGRGNDRVRRELGRLLTGTDFTVETLDAAIQQHFQVAILNLNPPLVETYVADQVIALTRDCPWQRLVKYIPVNPEDVDDRNDVFPLGLSATVTSQIWVPRDVKAVARSLDPQSWDVCGTLFGPPERTFLIKTDNAQTPVTDPSGQYVPGPLLAGSEYTAKTHLRLLFEHFSCLVPGCHDTWFKNLLYVATAFDWPPAGTVVKECPDVPLVPNNKRFVTTYSWYATLGGEIAHVPQTIKVDQGFLWAQTDAKDVGVNACSSKTVELDNKAAQGGLQASLQQAELQGQFAEMACCLVPSPAVIRTTRVPRWLRRTR
jgi:hypothetical protein